MKFTIGIRLVKQPGVTSAGEQGKGDYVSTSLGLQRRDSPSNSDLDVQRPIPVTIM